MRGGGHKLQHGKWQLYVRKNIFTIAKQWNRFSREVVASPPLRTQQGKALSNLFKLILLCGGKARGQMTSKGLFQAKLHCDSVILFYFSSGELSRQCLWLIEETKLIENMSMPDRIGPSYKWKGVIYPKVICATEGLACIFLFRMYFFSILAQNMLNLVELFLIKI